MLKTVNRKNAKSVEKVVDRDFERTDQIGWERISGTGLCSRSAPRFIHISQAPGALRLPDQTGVKLQLVAPLVVGITEGEPALAAAVKTHANTGAEYAPTLVWFRVGHQTLARSVCTGAPPGQNPDITATSGRSQCHNQNAIKEEATMASKKSKRRGKKKVRPIQALPVIRANSAGIDLGSREHWVCGPARGDNKVNVQQFGTTTPQLNELADWLVHEGVESVAMESTGVYWIPLYELLESRGLEVVLVNAKQLHGVPGRKTDMIDCQWIQLLHSCGLLRGSFRPGEKICALRALQRQMANLVEERSKMVQWMQKALDQMNVQVHRAVTDITGKTGMAIIRAIVAGQRSPKKLATLRDKRCRKSQAQFAEHLIGNWRREHLFNLRALQLYDQLEEMIAQYEQQLIEQIEALQPARRRSLKPPAHPNPTKERAMGKRGEQPMRTALWRLYGVDLTRIDAISTGAAQVALTEVGLDLSAFPDEHHFVSWLRLSPKMAFSAGKVLKKRPNSFGAIRMAAILRMCALTLRHSPSALGACYRRTARRKSGAVAVRPGSQTRCAHLPHASLRAVDEGAERYALLSTKTVQP